MGLKIKDIIKSEVISFEKIQGKTIVVDGTNLLFKYLTKIRNNQQILLDYQGNPVSHLIGFLYFIINLIERKVKPIFVFDGIPPREKHPYNYNKIKSLINAWKKYNSLGLNRKKSKYFEDGFFLYKYVIDDLINFIRKFGLPAIRAPSEGEAQAVRLVKEKKADGIISQDYDCLAFGCKKLYRQINFKINTLEYISLNKLLKELDITYLQFIDINILVGTDYNPGFKGFGPKTALKVIKKYGNIENMKNYYDFRNFDPKTVRHLFIHPITSEFDIHFGYPNFDSLKEYLLEKNFSLNRINNSLKRLRYAYKNFKVMQRKIDDFFVLNLS